MLSSSFTFAASTLLLAASMANAWVCIGVMEQDTCSPSQGATCLRMWSKGALSSDGKFVQTGLTGVGLGRGNLCGTYFDGIGTLQCTGDVGQSCAQIGTLGGFKCRTRCGDDKNCRDYRFPQLGQSMTLPPDIICA